MNRALLLDRDGVINEDGSYLIKPTDIRFVNGIFDLCRTAKNKGYRLIVVTNQSGIARGLYTEEDFLNLMGWMELEFEKRGVRIDHVYYCPFHPEKGIGRYKADSEDRKPKPGMILKAQNAYDLDLSKSVLIGDRDGDMECGRRAGVGTLLLLPERYQCIESGDVHVIRTLDEAAAFL